MRIFLLLLSSLFFFVNQRVSAQQSLIYVENKGQWKGDFIYKGIGSNAEFFLEKNGFTTIVGHPDNNSILEQSKEGVLQGKQTIYFHAYRMRWLNALAPVSITGDKKESYPMNFFLGNDPTKWQSGIYPVKAIEYRKIYDGIDVRVSSSQGNPKYDYIISPGADLSQLKLQYEGVDKSRIENGRLVLTTSVGEVEEMSPYAYQDINGTRTEVACKYVQTGVNTFGFEIGKGYNKNAPLVIDPEIVFATLTGSIPDNWGFTATYDAEGNLYAGGIVNGNDYPLSLGAFQITFSGGTIGSEMPCDLGITKFNASGTGIVYSTYIGGNQNDMPHSMIVDASGNLIISGKTQSTDYPVTTTAYDNSHNGMFDIFVTKLNADGSDLVGSTFVGGSGNDGLNVNAAYGGDITTLKYNYGDNSRSEVLIDDENNIFVAAATQSTNFPTTATAVKTTLTGTQDGVVIKLNSNLSTLIWSTYLGGASNDAAYVLAFDGGYDHVFVGGGTQSTDFMSTTTTGSLYPAYQGGTADGFICKFQNGAPYPLLTTTHIGTDLYDQVYGLQVDAGGNVYAMGQTMGAFPVTAGVYSNPNSTQFLIKLNNNLATNIYSTVWGTGAVTRPNIVPVAFLVDTCENVYISGWGGGITGSTITGLPLTADAFQPTTDGNDFYFIVFTQDATALLYTTYFGASTKSEHVDGGTSRFNPVGEVYQAICASCGPGSSAFPATPGAWASSKGSITTNCNLGAVKIAFNLGNVVAEAEPLPSDSGCAPLTVNFENHSTNAEDYEWAFGDGGTSTAENPTHTFTEPGVYTVRLIAKNDNGCVERDTTFITITVLDREINAGFNYTVLDSCEDFTASFANVSTSYSGTPFTTSTFTWKFGDGTPDFIGTVPPVHSFPGLGAYTVTLVMTDPGSCNNPDSIQKTITFSSENVTAGFDAGDICTNDNIVHFNNTSINGATYQWDFGDGHTSTDATPSNTYPGVGTYTVRLIAMNPDACNKSDTFEGVINVYPNPTANFYHAPLVPELNQPIDFSNTSVGATSYSWDFGDGNGSTETSPSHEYLRTGNYTVCLTAINQYGCKDTLCKVVRAEVLPLIDIPTAFSPNGDGSNDILFPRGFAVREMNLKIYNRWGELVFESSSMSHGWDGTYKGEEQPMDAYAFILTATFEDGNNYQKQGNITLIR